MGELLKLLEKQICEVLRIKEYGDLEDHKVLIME